MKFHGQRWLDQYLSALIRLRVPILPNEPKRGHLVLLNLNSIGSVGVNIVLP